jgi:hypothetical protein
MSAVQQGVRKQRELLRRITVFDADGSDAVFGGKQVRFL